MQLRVGDPGWEEHLFSIYSSASYVISVEGGNETWKQDMMRKRTTNRSGGEKKKKSGDTGWMAFMLVEELPVWQIEARQQPLSTSIKAAMLMSTATLTADAAVGVSARVHSVSYVLTAPAR